MPFFVVVWWSHDAANPERARHFHVIELEVESFEQACDLIVGDELIRASELYTHAGIDPGERIVHRRVDIAFRGSSVARIEVARWKLTEQA